MSRVSTAVLQAKIDRLNTALGRSTIPWTQVNGRNKASVGTFCLDHNACGWSIEEMSNESGGVCQPFGYRSMTSGELAIMLDAILSAIEITQKQFGLAKAA